MKPSLNELRHLSHQICATSQPGMLPFPGLPQGIPRGTLTELCGPPGCGKTELLIRFLILSPSLHAAWIEKGLTLYPFTLFENRIEPSRVLLIDLSGANAADPHWIARQALSTPGFPVVVLSQISATEIEMRRLQLFARKAQAQIFFLNEVPTPARKGGWAITTQLRVHRHSERKSWRSPEVHSTPDTALDLQSPTNTLPAIEVLKAKGAPPQGAYL